jgi:outer membrane protein OmpA-like peptidoglycan-associated protein
MKQIRITLYFLLLAFFALQLGIAQETKGRWVVGFHGGLNTWYNDYNHRVLGAGGEFMLRYGIGRGFSAGLLIGYEELTATQDPPLISPYGYLKLHAIPASFVGWIHFAPGKPVNPYLYAGIGAMYYKRSSGAISIPDGKLIPTIHIPLGIGLEVYPSSNISLIVDAGYRIMDAYTDALKLSKTDGYATVKAGVNIYIGRSDLGDADKDGLTNGDEKAFGTNPDNPDSDGDGLNDGDEVHKFKTDPLKVDSDGDGLNDGDEVRKYHTDPTKADTDGDGLSDGDEVLKYHTDPLKIDTDGDGLSDGDEVIKYKSDPLKVDTDGDKLSDYDEVQTYRTDPTKVDTDTDGLSDYDEVTKYKTNPLKSDTDGGGMSDGEEVKRGTNPLDPKDDVLKETIVLEKGKTVILKGVNFEFNKATLTMDSENTLEMAYNALVAQPDIKVLIVGHTDAVGSDAYNKKLSFRRAETVKNWMVAKGISARRMSVAGKGEIEPIDSNETDDGRANNRRIEFRVLQ